MIFIPTSRAMVAYDAIELLKANRKIIIISINEDSGADSIPPLFPKVKADGMDDKDAIPIPVLVLNFTDISRRVGNHKMFNCHMARMIFAFVGYHDEVDVCLVHCHAGVSRSPAVCAGLSLHYNGKCDEYFDKYVPNQLVFYRMVEQSYKLKTKGIK